MPRWAIGTALVVSVTTAVTGLGTTSASAQWPPAAPVQQDYNGTKWDRYMVPENESAAYYLDGEPITPGAWISTNGASEVVIVARHWNDSTQTFTLEFGTESDALYAEAPNAAHVAVGACNPATGGTPLSVSYTNVTDSSGWPHDFAVISVDRWDGEWGTMGIHFGEEVADGTTSLTKATRQVLPGTHDIFLRDDPSSLDAAGVRVGTVFIPGPCGKEKVPTGDPSGLGGSASSPGQPAAQIIKTNAKMAKVRLDNRGGKAATTFQVIAKPKGKKAKKVTRVVAKGSIATVKVKARKIVRVKVKVAGKTIYAQKV